MKIKLIAAAVALSAWTVSVSATPVNVSESNGEDSLQTILDNLTVGAYFRYILMTVAGKGAGDRVPGKD